MKMIVEAFEKGLKFRNGRFIEVLEPGVYRLARIFAKEQIQKVDVRLRTMILQGQEILTADKVTLRLTILAKLRITDPVAAILKVDDFAGQLYGDVQLALRDAVGALDLDAIISQKGRVGEQITQVVRPKAAVYGVELVEAGVRDLILPGEMKTILNQVMEAKKKAEASLILRREEVAATRSMANTAEILAKNPVLLRLKELEAFEKVLGRGASIMFTPEMFGLIK